MKWYYIGVIIGIIISVVLAFIILNSDLPDIWKWFLLK